MQKLNRKLEYSLMALKHMSLKAEGALTTAKEVAESYQTPFDATARVLQIMASRGWLKSEQGAFGGYKINRRLEDVTLLDLIELIEGAPQISKCLHKKTGCEIQSSCNIVSPIHVLNARLNQFYQSFSLAELLNNELATSVASETATPVASESAAHVARWTS